MVNASGKLIGALQIGLIASAVLAGFGVTWGAAAAGMFGWSVVVLTWSFVGRHQRFQVTVLLGCAAAAFAWAAPNGATVSTIQVLAGNHAIIAMLVGVSFLYCASVVRDGEPSAPRGLGAIARTIAALNVMALVLNISALALVAQRVVTVKPGHPVLLAALSRTFCQAVMISPFIGGMALALDVAPGASLGVAMIVGTVSCTIGVVLVIAQVRRRAPELLESLDAYPFRVDVLWLPAALAVVVVAMRFVFPDTPILTSITLAAPIVSVFALLASRGARETRARLGDHAVRALPQMGGEVALFLSAGLMASGLGAALQVGDFPLELESFGPGSATIAMVAISLTGLLGLHPVIGLAAITPLILPLDPDPTLVVMMFVATWAYGCLLCPVSGTNLLLQGRYGAAPFMFAREGVVHVTVMFVVSSALMYGYSALV
jgi:hypothetical protein